MGKFTTNADQASSLVRYESRFQKRKMNLLILDEYTLISYTNVHLIRRIVKKYMINILTNLRPRIY